jgi:alpha-tubulin suppressor-like RCC1 family protein
LFVWGNNSHGQLGNESKTNESSPFLLRECENMKIIQIACGYDHSIAFTGEKNEKNQQKNKKWKKKKRMLKH